MKTDRLSKVARLIQKDLSDIFLLYGRNKHVLISVSEVRVTSDIAIATVFLSVYPTEQTETIMESIHADMRKIRKELGDKERFQLRIIPELRFNVDTTLDRLEHIDKLLNN